MKLVTMLATAALVVTSFVAQAQQQVDKTLQVSAGTSVYLNNERGDLNVITHDKNEVRIVGTLDEDTEEFIAEIRGNGVRIEVRTPDQNGWYNDNREGSDLTLYLPRVSPLKVEGVSMDVEAEELDGGVDINLVSGDLRISKASKSVSLKTVSGDISAQHLSGEIVLESVSGDIKDTDNTATQAMYQAVSGDIEVSSDTLRKFDLQNVSGDVRMKLGAVKEARVKNVSGDLAIDLALVSNGSLEASSVSGDMEFKFTDDVNATFDIGTNAGGDIRNHLTNDRPKQSRWGTSSELEFTAGNGAGQVRLSTVSGSVEIRRH